ncbi:hypothetical protein O181_019375 [Austropuccinia psidii MF-1]|uniref:Integrase catalytic domain-containing protein n=1 Tax=Austropuccinia psidii MF-1 TaxID=1389203 RepID=A0A9Q3CAH5_9BASI|nr:hypothetical protein [Austropuccinia psidii MF-1]
MNWVTELPPSCYRSYNACLVIEDRYSKTPIFLLCYKDDTPMDTALLLWNRLISHKGLFKNIISDREPKFTYALWTNLQRFFGIKSSFSTAYHPQADGLAERMIRNLDDMIRGFCAYGLQLKESDGFTHDRCTIIPELELEYNTSVHSSTGQNPAMLEKGWNPRLPEDTLRKYLTDIHPTASSFKMMLDKVKHHSKKAWRMLLNIQNRSPKKLKNSYVGSFVIVALDGTNEIPVELSGELENKHTAFPDSLIKPYQPAEKELFPLRNPTPLAVPPVEQSEEKNIKKVIKEERLRGKKQQEYLFRYGNQVHEDG